MIDPLPSVGNPQLYLTFVVCIEVVTVGIFEGGTDAIIVNTGEVSLLGP